MAWKLLREILRAVGLSDERRPGTEISQLRRFVPSGQEEQYLRLPRVLSRRCCEWQARLVCRVTCIRRAIRRMTAARLKLEKSWRCPRAGGPRSSARRPRPRPRLAGEARSCRAPPAPRSRRRGSRIALRGIISCTASARSLTKTTPPASLILRTPTASSESPPLSTTSKPSPRPSATDRKNMPIGARCPRRWLNGRDLMLLPWITNSRSGAMT